MTINTTSVSTGPYTGNGVTDTFAYDFKVQLSSEIVVTQTDLASIETVLVEGTDYTVTGVGNNGGGTVVRVAGALTTGYTWLIERSTEQTQEADFPGQGAFTPLSHEKAFDKLTQIVQEIYASAVVAGTAAARADKMLSFDDAGDAETNIDANDVRAVISGALATGVAMTSDSFTGDGSTAGFVISTSPPAVQSVVAAIDGVVQTPITDYGLSGSTVTFTTAPPDNSSVVIRNFGATAPPISVDSTAVSHTPSWTGASARNVQLRLMDFISVNEFGADNTGATDSSTAINNAITAASNRGGGVVVLPGGTYALDGTASVALASNVYLLSQGATIKIADNTRATDLDFWAITIAGISGSGILGTLKINGNSANQGVVKATADVVDIFMLGVKVGDGASDIVIDNLIVDDVAGSGLSIGKGGGTTEPTDVRVNQVFASNCWNTGVAITDGDGIVISVAKADSCSSNANFAQHGVDIETNNAAHILKDITIHSLHTSNNGSDGIQVFTDDAATQGFITIHELISNDNTDHGLALDVCRNVRVSSGRSYGNGSAGVYMPRDVVNIDINMDVYQNGIRGYNIVQSASAATSKNIKIRGNIYNNTGQGIQIEGTSGGVQVENVDIAGEVYDDQGTATQTYALVANTNVAGIIFNARTSGHLTAEYVIGNGVVYLNVGRIYHVETGIDIASIPAHSTANQTVTVTGVAAGDRVFATPDNGIEAGLVWSAYCSATDTVTLRVGNVTTGAIDPASRTWRIEAMTR